MMTMINHQKNNWKNLKFEKTYMYSTHVVEVYMPRWIVYGENSLWVLPHNKWQLKVLEKVTHY